MVSASTEIENDLVGISLNSFNPELYLQSNRIHVLSEMAYICAYLYS